MWFEKTKAFTRLRRAHSAEVALATKAGKLLVSFEYAPSFAAASEDRQDGEDIRLSIRPELMPRGSPSKAEVEPLARRVHYMLITPSAYYIRTAYHTASAYYYQGIIDGIVERG